MNRKANSTKDADPDLFQRQGKPETAIHEEKRDLIRQKNTIQESPWHVDMLITRVTEPRK